MQPPSLFMCFYDQDGELEDVPPPPPPPPPRFFFGVNLDYLDFSGGIFDLLYEPTIRVPTKSDTHRPVQSQEMVRGWKFWI